MLHHELKWSNDAAWFHEQHQKFGAPLPPELQSPPQLDPAAALYYIAFQELFSCRADAGIPWSTIRDYADHHGILGEIREDLFHHVRAMDLAWMKWRSSNGKAE